MSDYTHPARPRAMHVLLAFEVKHAPIGNAPGVPLCLNTSLPISRLAFLRFSA